MFDLNFLNKPVPAIENIRKYTIYTGKRNPEFKKAGDGPKYKDEYDIENSGSINLIDAYILNGLVEQIKPEYTFEIGTWFGTSAAIMAKHTFVWTCDKHNYAIDGVKYNNNIVFYNISSSRALTLTEARGQEFDFAFIDGSLSKEDARKLVGRMRRKFIAFHDFTGDKKGVRNYKRVKKLFNGTLLKPAKGSSIALYFEKGENL